MDQEAGKDVPLSISTWHLAPSTNYDWDWKNNRTRCVWNHMIGTTFLACCYFQIARDKAYLQCKNEVSFDNQQLFYTERREGLPPYQDFTPLHSHVSAGARSAMASRVLLGSPSPLGYVHTSLFPAVRARGDRGVCSGSGFPESFLLWHVERKQRPDSGPGQEGRSKRFGFAFFRKEARTESLDISTWGLCSAAVKHGGSVEPRRLCSAPASAHLRRVTHPQASPRSTLLSFLKHSTWL